MPKTTLQRKRLPRKVRRSQQRKRLNQKKIRKKSKRRKKKKKKPRLLKLKRKPLKKLMPTPRMMILTQQLMHSTVQMRMRSLIIKWLKFQRRHWTQRVWELVRKSFGKKMPKKHLRTLLRLWKVLRALNWVSTWKTISKRHGLIMMSMVMEKSA